MTAPGFRYPDYNAQLGTESALARSEWDTFLQRRKELVDSIAGRLQLQNAIGPAAASQVATTTEVNQGIAADRLAPPNVEELNKLIGAAQYYGIQGADKLPPDKLKMIVEQRRMAYQKAQKPVNQRTLGEHVAQTLVEDMAVFGLGATESLMRTAVRIPFIGDAIQKQASMQDAQQWFGTMNEGVLASMPQGESTPHRIFRGAGGMVAYTLPATAAYKAIGAVGALPSAIAIGSRMSPLARAAIAELGTAWALEGGGEASLEERAQNVALAAGFGTVLRSIPFIAQRIRDRFSPGSGPVGGVAAPGGGFRERPGVVGQEVSGQAVEVPVLGAGQRALPPGPRPQIEGPGIETPFAPQGGPGTTVADYRINPQNLGNRGNLLPTTIPAPAGLSRVSGEADPFTNPTATAAWDARISRAETTINAQVQNPRLNELTARLMRNEPLSPAELQERSILVTEDDLARRRVWTADMYSEALDLPSGQPGSFSLVDRSHWSDRAHTAVIHHGPDGRPDGVLTIEPYGQGNAMVNVAVNVSSRRQGIATALYQKAEEAGLNLAQYGGRSFTPEAAAVQRSLGVAIRDDQIVQTQFSPTALTKEATIMESPALAQVAHEADIDESTVARASLASHPGQISVIQGVGDIGKTVRGLIAAQNQGKLLPHQFRVVQRGESTDLLISEGLPITNKHVAQYQAHGMFEGQLATSSMGNDVRIINPAGEFATVQSVYGGENYFVPREMLMPGKATVGGEEVLSSRSAAVTWERFKQFATKKLADEGQRAGLPGFNWNDGQVSTQLPRLIGEFLSGQKMKPGERMAMEAYFDHVRVREFQSLAPQEMGAAHAINQELNTAVVKSSQHLARLPMEDIAATKGFGYIANAGGQGGTLVDRLSDLRVDVGSESEALEFVRDFRREVPDYTPVTDVPMEAMPQHPMAANPGIDLEPVHRGGEAAVTAGIGRTLRQIIQSTSVSPAPPSSLSPPAAPPASPPPPPPPPPSLGAPNPGGGFFPTGRPSPVPSLGEQFATARAERPAELHAMLEELDSVWLRYGAPFRSFTLQVQQKLTNVGITEGKLWKHYYDLTTAVTQVHNESRPWHSEWNNIMTQFGRKKRRDGTVLRIEEIGDYNQKIAAMKAAGYSQREMAAQGRIRGFFDRLHDEAGISNYIFSYVPKVRQRQAMGMRDPYTDEGLPPTVQFFAEFARTGNLQMRQQDMGVLGTTWIRAWQFKKHAEGPWNQMVTAWQDPRVPEELQQIVTNWLNVVRTGYNQSYDPMVQGIRHTLNKNGIPITDAEVAGMWNTIFSNMYRGALGGRPDVIFRDATGPLFTGARIGMTPVAEVYTRFMRGGGRARDEMWDRALKGGWVEAGQVRSVNAETFTQPLVTDAGTSLLSPEQQGRRELFARIGDFVHDMLPPSWRNGIQGSKFDPLFYYTKLGEFNRLISGEAGWQVASKAIANYEAAVSKLVRAEQARSSALGSRVPQRGVPAFEQAMDNALAKLMDDSKALVYRPPVQQEFKRLIQANDYEGAANLLANEAANMQFRYGMKENPIGVREAGNTGRMAMMYGTFTQQYISYMKESLASHVPIKDRAAFLARYAGITGALGLAGAYTGWNFSKWMWHQSLTFAGGPMFQGAVKLAQAGAGAVTSIMGNEPNPDQAAAMRSMNPYELIPAAVGSLFPYRSTFNTLNSYEQAMNNLNPGESMLRQTLTGDPTMRTDIQQFFQNQQAFMPVPAPPAAAIPGAPTSALPAPQMQQLGVTDSSKVRLHTNGYPVYDTDRRTSDGKSPTHRLDIPSGRGPGESWEQYEDRVNSTPVTSFSVSDWRANRNPGDLDPDVRTPLMQMIAAAASEGHKLSINETYRPPSRQELLFKQGRSLPGDPVTWTLTSDHTTRRAADLRAPGQAGYVWIQENGPRFGFKVLGMFDPGHVSIPLPAQGGAPQVAGGAQRQLSGAGAQQ